MSNGNGHRWSKFWWQDWQNDAALRMCSLAAQGLWMRVLCLMHDADGYLLINGRQPSTRQIAAMVSADAKEVTQLIHELEQAGVFSRTDDGTVYSRRMVRDVAASEAGREHIAKRWHTSGTTDPPNRGANRSPTSKPNGDATSHPTRPPSSPPITRSLEAESEPEAEEEKKVSILNNLLTTSPAAARVVDACQAPSTGTYGDPAIQFAAQNIVEKLGRKFESSGKNPQGKPAKRSALVQAAAVLRGPLLDDEPVLLEGEILGPPIRRGPCDPQRTVAEQLAALGFPELAARAAAPP